MNAIEKYGAKWPWHYTDLQIEIGCIRMGGRWQTRSGKDAGLGLKEHFLRAQALLWPDLDDHRWHRLIQEQILDNQVCVLMGPGSSGKTHEAAKYALTDYWANPDRTVILMSSTDSRGLELRVWGEVKMLFNAAKERHRWLAGNILESRRAIATDNLDDGTARDLRKGIICIPCLVNHRFVGLGKYAGIKQKRVRLIADESQFMPPTFLEAMANLDKNPDFKAVILGNPIDIHDSLGRAAEPEAGWESVAHVNKTSVWKTRFMGGVCVNLVGTDSPNFDFPEDQPPQFPYLIHRGAIRNTVLFYGQDSLQYYSQCVGIMRPGAFGRRVITPELCRKHGALEPAVWMDGRTTKIYAVDAAYFSVGGDRCVAGFVEFGLDFRGRMILAVRPPVIINMDKGGQIPEDHIAETIRADCEANGIPPENVFFDSTGRGALGTAFARVWSPLVNPVEFGGAPSDRPVCSDLFTIDEMTGVRRLKLCSEHYSKRVTELWFSVRYLIEAGQMRGLPDDVMREGCLREWKIVRGGKIEVETKTETRKRMGRSPDLFDWLATAVEGARQRGFVIARMAARIGSGPGRPSLEELARESAHLLASRELDHTVVG